MVKKLANVSNFHMQYSDLTSQHWHPTSARYAGGDNLMTAIEKDWDVEQCALVRHWYAGMRSVRIYEFTLIKNGKTMTMPVLDNPYVERFVIDEKINLIETEEAKV